eukprot:scaffold17631_cov148-Skeletonema_menzelii.AAC.1
MTGGKGGRPAGKKNGYRSVRKQNTAQKKRQAQRCAATKAKNKKEKEQQKAAEEGANKEKKKAERRAVHMKFFGQQTQPSSGDPVSAAATNTTTITNDTTTAAATVAVDTMSAESGDPVAATTAAAINYDRTAAADDDVVIINNPAIIGVVNAADATAELDYNHEEAQMKGSDDFDDDTIPGIQQQYVAAVQRQVQSEVSKDSNINNHWLLQHLKQNDWWLRKENYLWFIKNYNKTREKEDQLDAAYKAYYRDVNVWLPDVRWKTPDNRFMPCCPTCKTSTRVGPHCFRDNHAGRVIVGQTETYYTVSRRYICHECEGQTKQAKEQFEAAAKEKNLIANVELDDSKYTFMGWDQTSLTLLPYNKGSKFPAFLTWRAGVDKTIITTLRQDVAGGKGFDRISKDLLEHHTEKYTDWHLEYEYSIKERLDGGLVTEEHQIFGDFRNAKLYRGLVPTGAYLQHVYLLYHDSIRTHLIKEVKKRVATSLCWDVSYKEAKHVSRVRGQPVFKGLVTAMNEFGEIRIQFHVYTDSHEQMTAALEAFKRTTESLGQPPVKYFWTDNPIGDRGYFLEQIPSLRDNQDALNAMCNEESGDASNAANLPMYDYKSIEVHVEDKQKECTRKITAMLADMNINDRTIGLDAEWNVEKDGRGQETGCSKVMVIQMAYRDKQNKMIVLIFKTGKWGGLPNNLTKLFLDNSYKFVGVNVSADLKKIARDFDIRSMKKVDQKKRANVINLGLFARKRDVIENAKYGSMTLLAKLVLGIKVDKSQQESDWSGDLNSEQIQYAALDAAISLELYEKLATMPDLTSRLTEEELTAGMKVDLAPQAGQYSLVALLNTRAATATVIGRKPCLCPEGIVPKGNGKGTKVKPCANSYVVKVDTIYATGFIIPGYKKKDTNEIVSLEDIGLKEIVVPIAMLRNHIASDAIRATPAPAESQDTECAGPTPPASEASPAKRVPDKRLRQPLSEDFDYSDSRKEPAAEPSVAEDEQYIDYDEFITTIVEESKSDTFGLTSQDISMLKAAIFEAEEAQNGKPVLSCNKLDDAPLPQHIKNLFSVILGDIYHAMNRAKVPVKHEAKKAYFHALRNAFLIWNPKKVEQFESKMRDDGMDDKEIEAIKYFKPHLYDECIERHAPAPRILYYRVRAVFALFGNMLDSKTKKPLFNDEAWKKANQVLKEILAGVYSDPPDVILYSKKMSSNGRVMKNKYGMELVECFRGTNRVEAYHKKLHPIIKSKNCGVQMAAALLAELRHRHNQMISEQRRAGHKIGHFSLHKIDQLQELYLENHGRVLYPGWDSASAYKQTEESFDTIALHHSALQDELKARRDELGDVKLTKDLQYMCDAMGVPLPLLPFAGEAEDQLFAKLMLEHKGKFDDEKFALHWCKHVDPEKGIHAKLPCHIRAQDAKFDRNQRIRATMEKARSGKETLDELHSKIVPTILEDESAIDIQEDDSPASTPSPPSTTAATSRKRKTPPVGLSRTLQEPTHPRHFPIPPPQAMHNAPYVQHGGMLIGTVPPPKQGHGKIKLCTLCWRNEGANAFNCPGRGSHNHCRYFYTNNERKFVAPQKTKAKTRRCKNCGVIGCKGVGGHKYCTNKK